MRTFLSQIIVILLLLLVGFILLKKLGGDDSRELGFLQEKLEVLNEQNEELLQNNQKLTKEKDLLQLANRFLKTDRRTARIEVLEQKTEPESGENQNLKPRVLETKIRFTEFNQETGAIIAKPQEFTISGDLVYVDALIVKFEDVLVESSDLLKNHSLVSFQRIFGENQSPGEGFRIDVEGRIPSVYSSGNENEEASAMEKEIWEHFWEISNSPERQKELGIRAIHGEAPSQRLVPGRIYNLELRASDGLSFKIL